MCMSPGSLLRSKGMTRSTAREIAIRLGFAAAASGVEPEALMEEFFSEEHYASLAAEDLLFQELPDKRQMDYIRRLTALLREKQGGVQDHGPAVFRLLA